MTWTEAGIWLIGIGSFLTVVTAIVGSPRPTVGGARFRGPLTSTRERVIFAAEATGIAHVGAGSVIIAIAELPELWFVAAASASVILLFYGLNVWKQHTHRAALREDWAKQQSLDEEMGRWMTRCRERCSTWRWSLRHPFEDEPWPQDCDRALGRRRG